ncbi:MAG: peroxide stress protein YaaA [Myxococcota bacterium]
MSPAKKLDDAKPVPTDRITEPRFVDDAAVLLERARALTRADLTKLMHVSDALATSTFERFQAMSFAPEGGRQAVLTFAGEVYQGLDATTLGAADLDWAQDHVAILSGLYGLLRPLDRMRPYRLEMGTKLANPGGKDLVSFWRERITPAIDAAVAGHEDPTVVNLASDEYFSAIDRKRLQARVVTPVFQDVKAGKARSLFLFVKRARGAMTRWLVEQRVERAEALKEAEVLGYRFVAEASEGDRWVFRRPQPPSPS